MKKTDIRLALTTNMYFEYIMIPEWPPLAWLAYGTYTSETIAVFHGSQIEVTDEWFCEAVWAGDYDAGGFDQTDIVAGSGGRLRQGLAIFVSSGSTVDRLQFIECERHFWISNSLVCLLVAVQGSLDPGYSRYFEDFESIIQGIHRYQIFINTSAGQIHLTYFHNITWDGTKLEVQAKPNQLLGLVNFASYESFLKSSLQRVVKNMTAGSRRHPLRMLGTVSSGYDSATVSAIAREGGCGEVICFHEPDGEDEDNGEAVAKSLGMRTLIVSRSAWQNHRLPEVPFLASDSRGEDVYFKGAEQYLAGRVLLTGYAGDTIWDKNATHLTEDITRGDQSGLSLTEYRLSVGFIHCPIPFWGIRHSRDIHAISNSLELKPWDIGGDYSRPICRRILEEAGVPRSLFGFRKRAASVRLWLATAGTHRLHGATAFLSSHSMADYLEWLRQHRWDWIRHGHIPPVTNPCIDRRLYSMLRFLESAGRDFINWADHQRGLWRLHQRLNQSLSSFISLSDVPLYLRRYVFSWAIERAKQAYYPVLVRHPGIFKTESGRGSEHRLPVAK